MAGGSEGCEGTGSWSPARLRRVRSEPSIHNAWGKQLGEWIGNVGDRIKGIKARMDELDRERCGGHVGAACSAFLKALVMVLVGLWAVDAIDVALLLTADRREIPYMIPLLIIGTFLSNVGTANLIDARLAKGNAGFVCIQAVDVAATYFIIAWGAPQYRDLSTTRTALCILLGSIVGPALFAALGSVFSSDAIGMVMIIPFVLSLNPKHLARCLKGGPKPCALAFLCLLAVAAIEISLPLALFSQSLFSQDQLRFLAHSLDLPIVIFAGFLVGNFGFTLASLAMGVTAVASTVFLNRGGRLATNDPDLLSELLRLQIVMFAVELASLTFMVIQSQRDKALELSDLAGKHKSAFMAFLCHELRNPLHAIINISAFLGDSELDSEQAQLCEAIRVSSSYMSELLNDVLDSAKLEAGKLKLNPQRVNVEDVLWSVLKPFKEDVKTKALTFFTDLRDVDAIAELDTIRIKQVINNLLSNAIKFTPENGRISFRATIEQPLGAATFSGRDRGGLPDSIATMSAFPTASAATTVGSADSVNAVSSISPKPRRAHGRPAPSASAVGNSKALHSHPSLVVQVSDNGIGMQSDVIGKLFRPYEQLSSTRREYGGTGLGLSICKQLVDLMEGTIEVESFEGAGTTFTVRIPAGVGMELGDEEQGVVAAEEVGVARRTQGREGRAEVRIGYEMDVLGGGAGGSAVLPARKRSEVPMTASAVNGPKTIVLGDAIEVDVAGDGREGPDRIELLTVVVDDGRQPKLDQAANVMNSEPFLVSTSSGSVLGMRREPSPARASHSTLAPDEIEPTPLPCKTISPPMEKQPLVVPAEVSAAFVVQSPDAAAHSQEPPTPSHACRPRQVLVVDDSLINRRILRKLMETLGVDRCDECENGQQAVELIEALADPSAYDVIFMDIQMPVLLGTEATKLIREKGCESAIIAVTANSVPGEGFLEEWGFTALAPKPFLKKDAEKVIKEYMNREPG
ncbi:hypothetical protein HK101_007611 [Irineochytrium annulatum]|nr:hypothetical protein HK101_007611 [Irineochytrium annulatum]